MLLSLFLGASLPEQEPQEFWILLVSAVLQPPVQYRGGVPWRERDQGYAFLVPLVETWVAIYCSDAMQPN